MKVRSWLRLSAVAGYLLPLVIPHPRETGPSDGADTLDDAVRLCQESGLEGRALIDFAAHLVGKHFVKYSIRAPWKPVSWAWRERQGSDAQYNRALSQILTRLGIKNQLVFAARVRTTHDNPWWWMNHVWVRVVLDERERDVCARFGRTVGDVAFTPLSPVQPFLLRTRITTTVAACIGSAWEQWSAIAGGGDVPPWLEEPFHRELD